ncbi:MAG: N-acetylmuramoyl-L-alanine amidase [Clostridia bacterium]|nr:N-acetylmuramoyl-L-alanine amidase [Clostridia bacterium]
MKHSKKHLIETLSAPLIIFLCVIFATVIISSFVLESVTASSNTDTPSIGYTVVIDAGHGGLDPGSIGYKTKVRESDVNLAISKKLETELKKAGISVVMTRTTEEGLYGLSTNNYKKRDMAKRREIIENARPNMVISVHMNSYVKHNLRGAQAFYDKNSEISRKLALAVQDQFASNLEESDKGVSIGDYFMLKCTQAPSIITECGFLSNEEDEKLLLSDAYQNKIVSCIVAGVLSFLGIAE